MFLLRRAARRAHRCEPSIGEFATVAPRTVGPNCRVPWPRCLWPRWPSVAADATTTAPALLATGLSRYHRRESAKSGGQVCPPYLVAHHVLAASAQASGWERVAIRRSERDTSLAVATTPPPQCPTSMPTQAWAWHRAIRQRGCKRRNHGTRARSIPDARQMLSPYSSDRAYRFAISGLTKISGISRCWAVFGGRS